jgi:hypothetical protein
LSNLLTQQRQDLDICILPQYWNRITQSRGIACYHPVYKNSIPWEAHREIWSRSWRGPYTCQCLTRVKRCATAVCGKNCRSSNTAPIAEYRQFKAVWVLEQNTYVGQHITALVSLETVVENPKAFVCAWHADVHPLRHIPGTEGI